MRVLAVCQLLGTFYTHWFQLEGLKEERLSREQGLRMEEAKVKAQLAAFKTMLKSYIGAEEARSQSFIAAMQALSVVQDPEVTRQILAMAHELLDRPLVVPQPYWDRRS
jgi:hypothetical protein